jgi:CRP/FNR family nitrogen fixation transcriptional regulator
MTHVLTQNLPAPIVRPNAASVPAIRVGRPSSTLLTGHPALVATESSYESKQEIYGEGEPADYVYQVVRGAVRTYKLLNDGRRQIGAFHLPGDVFGLESVAEHRLTAEAIVETTVRVLKRRALEAAAKTDVRIACELWTKTSNDLRHAENHMLLLGRKTAAERVATFLLEMDRRLSVAGMLSLPCAGATSPTISASPWRPCRGRCRRCMPAACSTFPVPATSRFAIGSVLPSWEKWRSKVRGWID